MFETQKTLIVVYKDELLMNYFRKLVETHDDVEGEIVGTKDDSINIVSWEEDVWLSNKKAGNIKGKILFLGDVKDTDKLIPVMDVVFEKYGVKYGWSGNQAVLYADVKALTARKDYDTFLTEFEELPVPDSYKIVKEQVADEATPLENDVEPGDVATEGKTTGSKITAIREKAKRSIDVGTERLAKIGHKIAVKQEEIFRNKGQVKTQMMLYGIIKLYNDDLENFMNQ